MELNFTINGISFEISQIPCGEHEDKWCWSTSTSEGKPYATALEAQQDALDYIKRETAEEAERAEQEAEDAIYGSYDDQVRQHFNSTRL